MTKRTARPIVIACLALGCGSESGGQGPEPFSVPPFGATPSTATAPAAGQNRGNAVSPGGTVGQGGANEGAGSPGLLAPAQAGSLTTTGPTGSPAPAGTPATLDVTIQAETLNQTVSKGFGIESSGTAVGSIEVGSVLCFDNVDLTGVQSIDVSYARNQPEVSSFARFAILWGSNDVATALNLGEKLTSGTGGWTTFQTLNVGLARQVSGVGQLCFRGLQGNGILNMDSFTLRRTAGTNDGVTDFKIPVPTGPAVPAVRVVGREVQFGGPGTSVAGNSFFWSNGKYGADQFYTPETVKWLKDNWGSQIVRAALAVDDSRPGGTTTIDQLGGYLTQPFDNEFNVQKVVNAAIANGMYAIIDFHGHHVQDETAQAVQFFSEMASFYGGFNNVIYEIYNEPTNTDWPTIKAYAQRVIAAIRAADPDNLIIVGTPNFSQDVDVAAGDPINDPNVAYTLHFYAGEGAHDQLRTKATAAMNDGVALFVTEWGTTPASGLGAPNQNSTNTWMDFLEANNISHCNWGVADQTQPGAAQLVRGASPSGGWTDAQLSASGQLAKRIISGW
jgi:hypothetical protein